jgi:hypothetical protein
MLARSERDRAPVGFGELQEPDAGRFPSGHQNRGDHPEREWSGVVSVTFVLARR